MHQNGDRAEVRFHGNSSGATSPTQNGNHDNTPRSPMHLQHLDSVASEDDLALPGGNDSDEEEGPGVDLEDDNEILMQPRWTGEGGCASFQWLSLFIYSFSSSFRHV